MGLTVARPDGPRVVRREPQLRDVIAEHRRHSAARAAAGDLVDEPGIVGVTGGTEPVLWLYSEDGTSRIHELLAGTHELTEIYVESAAARLCDLLTESGWTVRDVLSQVVVGGPMRALTAAPDGISLGEASAEELAQLREDITAASPTRVLVARSDNGEIVGTAALRRQFRSAMIFGLEVALPHRRRGVGSALVSAAALSALRDGAEFAHGLSGATSAGACARAGGQVVGRWARLVRSSPG